MRTLTFGQLFALAGVLAVTLSLLVSSVPVYASICTVSPITPSYPATADPSQMITINVPISINCPSSAMSSNYMNVQVQLMPTGANRVISSGPVERANPGVSNFTVPISVQTPSVPGPWSVTVVVNVVNPNVMNALDSTTTAPITIQIVASGSY